MRGALLLAAVSFACPCSALDKVTASVKDILSPSTGTSLAFGCTGCTHGFLTPSSATENFLASISHHPRELAAHGDAATLRKSTRKPPFRVHPSGVLSGKCCGCSVSSIHESTAARVVENCKSIPQKEGTEGLSNYVPSPAAMPWLWPTAEAAVEAAAKPNERRKVCAACRSNVDRRRRALGAPRSVPSPEAPSSGLDLLSSVAAEQAAAPDPPPPSPTIALEILMARYDTLSPSELQLFEALMETHLRAVRPPHISCSFRNGVNRRYELVNTLNRHNVVKTRQMRRRASALARAAGNGTKSDAPACRRAIEDILSAATPRGGVRRPEKRSAAPNPAGACVVFDPAPTKTISVV